jgi:hypothetical protein
VLTSAVVFGGWALVPAAAVANYAAFASRGALSLHRGTYNQRIRVLVETILERGQFSAAVVDELIHEIRTFAALDRATPDQLQRFDLLAAEIRAFAAAFELTRPSDVVSARELHETALAEFSRFLDIAGTIFGVQAQSMHRYAPNSGVQGRVLATALAATFLVNLKWHWVQAWTTSGLDQWVNGTYVVADVVFLAQAAIAAITGIAGFDGSGHPRVRRMVQLVGLPVITVANLLLTVQMHAAGDPLLLGAAYVLTGATAYLTKLAVTAELKLGRVQPRKGAWASTLLGGGVLAFGLAGLVRAYPVELLLVAVTAPVLLRVLSKIDSWWAERKRGPPPVRDATPADLALIEAQALVHPGVGVVLVAPGDPLRAVGLELRAKDEVVLVMHGDRDGFRYAVPGAVVRVSAAQVGQLLARLLPLPAGGPVLPLVACACSVGAQQQVLHELSSAAGRPVVANTGPVRVHRPDRYGAWASSGGTWVGYDAVSMLPSRPVGAPLALVAPGRVPGAERVGEPGVALPIAPRAPP